MPVERVTLIDLPLIEAMQPSDWKGVADHYRYYLEHDNCVALKLTEDGAVMAVGALIYHQDSAWLAHIIVHPQHRGKGSGTIITQALIDQVDKAYFPVVYLMSTELGFPVYKKLGFVEEGKQLFYISDMKAFHKERHPNIVPVQTADYPAIFDIDHQCSGEIRTYRLLQHIDQALVYKVDDVVKGFYIKDMLEGPVVAIEQDAGIALMHERMKDHTIAIVPEDNHVARSVLETNNWKVYRSARRMRLGAERSWNPLFLFNRFSGQIG